MKNTNHMMVQVRVTGYYDGFGGKMHRLNEGDTVLLVEGESEFGDPADAWKCKLADGRSVFIEFTDGKEIVLS